MRTALRLQPTTAKVATTHLVHIITDHVFGLCHLLGYRFAPRIKDLKDRKLYAIERSDTYPVL